MPSLVDVVLRKKQEAICLKLGNQEGLQASYGAVPGGIHTRL
jgi:hypothetical protein